MRLRSLTLAVLVPLVVGSAGCGGSHGNAPVARFAVSPPTVATDAAMTFDPSGSTDLVDPTAVEVQFYWGDGSAPSAWSAYSAMQQHRFVVPGTFNVVMKVRAGTRIGTDTSKSVTISPLPAPVAYRKFSPAAYVPGTKLTVTIVTTPGAGATSYSVEDTVPTGWAVSQISNSGVFDDTTGKVKWGPFFDNTNRSLTYVLTPPLSANGSQGFSGLLSVDGSDKAIVGWLAAPQGS